MCNRKSLISCRATHFAFACAWALLTFGPAVAQDSTGGTTTPTTPTTTAQPDLNQLLQQFGPLLGLTGTTTGITTQSDGTGTTTQPATPPTAEEGGPQPTIVGNQFTTTTGGALLARRPGLMTQRAMAVQSGAVELQGNFVDEPSWFIETRNDITDILFDTANGIVSALNALFAFDNPLTPGGSTGGTTTIPNAATSGGGTTTPIP